MNLAGTVTESGPVMVFGRRLGGELTGWLEMVLSRSDGSIVSAVRGPALQEADACGPVAAAGGDERVIAAIANFGVDPYVEYEVTIPLDGGVGQVFSELTPELLHGNIGSSRSPGPESASIELSPGPEIISVPYDGGTPSVVARYSADSQWEPRAPISVGADVLFWALATQDRGTAQIFHSATGATETYVDVPGADVVAIRADGATVVWMLSSPPYYQGGEVPDTVELWSAPYTADPGALAPTKVADLHPALRNAEMVFGSGIVVLRSSLRASSADEVSWSRNIALRLADKVYWNMDAPAGSWWGGTVYVTPDEVAMAIQPPWDASGTTTVRRLRLSALGAPTAVSGIVGIPPQSGGRKAR